MAEDVLVLIFHTKHTTSSSRTHLPTVQVHHFRCAARRDQIVADPLQPAETQAGFFLPFPLRDPFRALALLIHARHQLQQPGRLLPPQCAGPELLQQHHLIPVRIIRKHTGGVAAHKQFASETRHGAAVKTWVGQPELVHTEEALEDRFPFFDVDVTGAELEQFWHAGFRFGCSAWNDRRWPGVNASLATIPTDRSRLSNKLNKPVSSGLN